MLEKGNSLSADGREYTILETLGRGANTIAYLAECRHGELVTKCILKEFSPRDPEDAQSGKERFIASGKTQNAIRQRSLLNNQTPPVSHIFETNGTAYIDVVCFGGTTLDRLSLSMPQYMAICRTIARTAGCYHRAGYLCLDLKPENIFILQNSPDDTITQLVEFIDFDSIRDTRSSISNVFSYTREWAAPEQLDPYSAGRVGKASDIYTVGEIVFYLLFGRHSADSEHRGFSEYPFDECDAAYRRYTERPDIQSLFTRLFRGTIRSSPSNRFRDIEEVVKLLDSITAELERKDHVIPILPAVSPDFVGRDEELRLISEKLRSHRVLYVTGIGGIGKTTLIKKYISRCMTDCDVIVYLEYDGDIKHTFCDDMQLQLSTVSRQDGESTDDYFTRKLSHFRRICGDRKVLFVVDNFSGKLTKDMSRIIDCGYDTIIASRSRPPKNSFEVLEVGPISSEKELFRLIELDLGRAATKEEKLCFNDIIDLVQRHTLVIELIARQISAGRLDIRKAQALIRRNGFSRFSGEKIGNYKDGEEVYDTLSAIISALFDAGDVSETARLTLKILALLDVRGLEEELVIRFYPMISKDVISGLSAEGWLFSDKRVHLHPVIAETVRNWLWNTDDVTVMEHHKQMTDIYVGMANHVHIKEILREAAEFTKRHPRHLIKGMYYDMCSCYYDTLLDGAYCPETPEEEKLVNKLY
ncbi:MAG: serine/threonine protein kinase, partial [Ruminococcus sp.]|nr:serine/threonine protein kinase [Ruminococcus sp.]